jgi:hypothetical protein
MLCGRKSALPVVVEDPEANSDRAEGILTKGFDFNYRKRAAFVNERSQCAEEEFHDRGTECLQVFWGPEDTFSDGSGVVVLFVPLW